MALWVNFHRWALSTVPRVFKYYAKGFEVFVPCLDRGLFKTCLGVGMGVVNLIHVESGYQWNRFQYWWHKPDKKHRPNGTIVQSLLRTCNFWGTKHQSAYSEYIGPASFPYMMRAVVKKGMRWLGMIPRLTNGEEANVFDIDTIQIGVADRSCFYECSPNFFELYDRDKISGYSHH
jgi:hypothetical protein